MEWTFRTVVRGFLVFGGVAFIALGLTEGETFELLLGVGALLIGSIGLWIEWQQQSTADDHEDNL